VTFMTLIHELNLKIVKSTYIPKIDDSTELCKPMLSKVRTLQTDTQMLPNSLRLSSTQKSRICVLTDAAYLVASVPTAQYQAWDNAPTNTHCYQ